MRLRDKVALISGAASGMGAATAKLFASEGAIVFVTDLDESAGLEVVEEIDAAGHSAHFIKLDVSRDDDWRAAVSEAVDTYGRIDVLVNNASALDLAASPSAKRIALVMDVNARGTLAVASAADRAVPRG